MKKLLFAAFLGVASLANAQNFNQIPFLNCQSLSVSNTAGFTNNQPFFGWSASTFTNTTGIRYTNTSGTYIIVAATNTTSGFVSVSNGVAFSTNDTTALAFDVKFHADRNGNPTTNYLLSVSAIFNSTSTGALACVYVPIVGNDNPIGANPGPVLLDFNNTITAQVPVLRGGATNVVVAIEWSKFSGYRGFRLFSAGMTNGNGQAWIVDNSLETFVP